MVRKSICFLGLFIFFIAKSQDVEAFNKIYVKTYLETSQKDFKKAVTIADSLYTISETPLLQTKSLMLSATLYQQSNDLKKSVDYALKAEKIIENTNDSSWKARVAGFLATQYRLLALFDKSGIYAEKTLRLADKIENPEAANSTKGLMWQEKAYYNIETENYRDAVKCINFSQSYFDKISQNKDFLTANNKQLLGLSYYRLDKKDAALKSYQESLVLLKKTPENFMAGLVHCGLAKIYMDTDQLEKAKEHLDIAIKIADTSEYLQLKKEVYHTSQEYYRKTKDLEKLHLVNLKRDSIEEKISDKNTSFINDAYGKLERNNAKEANSNSIKNTIIFIISALIFVGILFFSSYRKKQKKELAKIKTLLNRTKNTEIILPARSKPVESITDKEPSGMSPETEEELLDGLNKFEEEELFKDNNISLSYVASYLNTNTKYLSYMIKKYKKKDFSGYVNELRINYIIGKLNTDPVYRQYKISVLAEEAGFSSHSKFATVFKNIAGVSPSYFIRYIEKNNT